LFIVWLPFICSDNGEYAEDQFQVTRVLRLIISPAHNKHRRTRPLEDLSRTRASTVIEKKITIYEAGSTQIAYMHYTIGSGEIERLG